MLRVLLVIFLLKPTPVVGLLPLDPTGLMASLIVFSFMQVALAAFRVSGVSIAVASVTILVSVARCFLNVSKSMVRVHNDDVWWYFMVKVVCCVCCIELCYRG